MKTLCTIPLAVFSFFFALAQAPVNDDCSGIINLGEVPYCSQAAQFTNLNATASVIDANSNIPDCWNNSGDRDVWFQFNLPTNGGLTDVTVDIWGDIAGNGTLKRPQLAIYRGICGLNGLAELGCISAPLNVNELHLDLIGLTPGVPYFLRINDYSANANPNSGTFKLCIGPKVTDTNMGDSPGSASCSGTLWDSGGPDADYQSNENATFVICPSEEHKCLKINFISFNTESTYDFIRVFEGDDISGTLLQSLDGTGSNFEIQSSSNCVTIEFESDGSLEEEGFQMTWMCSNEICDAPPPILPPNSTCDKALNINGCDNVPQVIPLSPGQGDPDFLEDGVNQGCFDLPLPLNNHSFFYFQATTNGKFGFVVQSANPLEASDIDFNVWGPISSVSEICNFVSTHQPIRSSWDEGADLTGLADVHPVFGTPVNDNFDCGSPNTPGTDPPFGLADDFVRRLDVLTGQIYVIMLDDYDGQIQENGIAIDFSGTSNGVLGPPSTPITVSNDTTICEGSLVQLQIEGGISFAWTPSTGLSCNDCPNPIASPVETITYEVVAVGVCQSLTTSVTITVVPLPMLMIEPANPKLCIGESTPLVVTNSAGLSNPQWSPTLGLSCTACFNPMADPTATTTYQFTANGATGCISTASVTVEVNQPPQFQFPNDTICSGESILLNLLTDSTASYSWTSNPPGFISSVAQPIDSPAQTTDYLVTMENGCTVQKQFTIQVIPPGNLLLSDPDTLCAGASTQVTASGNYPGIFQWNHGATGQVISVNPLQTTTYIVNYQYPLPNAQCQVIDSVTINVQGEVAQVQLPKDTLLCPGEGILLNTMTTPGASYSWTSNPPIFASNNPEPPVFYPEESAVYIVTTTLGNCSATYKVDVTVFNPQMVVSEDTIICAGEPVVISADAFLTGNYLWTPGGTMPTFQTMVTANSQFMLEFYYGDGCVYYDTVNISVIPNFTLKLVSDPDTNRVDLGVPIMLDAFVPGTNVTNFIFEWLENNTLEVGNTQQITVTPITLDSTVTYNVTVVSPNGCVQTGSITFTIIQPNIQIPNAFTPNGDGANDFFGLVEVEGVANIEKMEIYSRWGQNIFASNDPDSVWDGTIDGNDAPSDVYVYVIFWRGGDGALSVSKGEVTLLR
ncbi:MAG: gliding motility-associated C-terminal domain-containing protein [Saprospiraceae bacterium]